MTQTEVKPLTPYENKLEYFKIEIQTSILEENNEKRLKLLKQYNFLYNNFKKFKVGRLYFLA